MEASQNDFTGLKIGLFNDDYKLETSVKKEIYKTILSLF